MIGLVVLLKKKSPFNPESIPHAPPFPSFFKQSGVDVYEEQDLWGSCSSVLTVLDVPAF